MGRKKQKEKRIWRKNLCLWHRSWQWQAWQLPCIRRGYSFWRGIQPESLYCIWTTDNRSGIELAVDGAITKTICLKVWLNGLMILWKCCHSSRCTWVLENTRNRGRYCNIYGQASWWIKWSDGQDVTTGDFVYAWQRLANPETAAADYCYMIDMVQGYDAVADGSATIDTLESKLLMTRLLKSTHRRSPIFRGNHGIPGNLPGSSGHGRCCR